MDAPAGYTALPATACASAVASASELLLVQLPPGLDLARLGSVVLKLRAGAADGSAEVGRATLPRRGAQPPQRLRLLQESPALAEQLYAVPAPCAAAQGA